VVGCSSGVGAGIRRPAGLLTRRARACRSLGMAVGTSTARGHGGRAAGTGASRRVPDPPRGGRGPRRAAVPVGRGPWSGGVDGGPVAAVLADHPDQHPPVHAALLHRARRTAPDPAAGSGPVGRADRPAGRRHVPHARVNEHRVGPAARPGHAAPHPGHPPRGGRRHWCGPTTGWPPNYRSGASSRRRVCPVQANYPRPIEARWSRSALGPVRADGTAKSFGGSRPARPSILFIA